MYTHVRKSPNNFFEREKSIVVTTILRITPTYRESKTTECHGFGFTCSGSGKKQDCRCSICFLFYFRYYFGLLYRVIV